MIVRIWKGILLLFTVLTLTSCDNTIKGSLGKTLDPGAEIGDGGNGSDPVSSKKVTISSPVSSFDIEEGQKLIFFVVFDKPLAEDADFTWSLLENNTDFTASSGIIHGSQGTNAISFSLQTINDQIYEPIKNYTLKISSEQAKNTLTTTLRIEDDQSRPSASFLADAFNEGENITATIRLSHLTSEEVTYSYEIGDESALVGADYTASPASGTIVIPPLTYEANIVIPTVNDSNVESPEYFHILLTNGINTSTTSVSVYPYIYDDDTSTVYARWKSPNLSYDEGDGSVTVEAVLNKTASSNVQIPFTVSGTAANPDKHDLVGGTITIPTGQLSASVSFNLVDDAIPGLAKTVVLTKGTVVNATWAGSSTDVVNILDNDELPTLDLNLESQTVAEDVGTVVIPVQLSATAGDNVSIPYTIKNITTSRTHDHTADSGTLVITAGSMSGNINIPIVDDLRIENTESMSITLGSATGALVQGTTSFTLNITDNDSIAPTLDLKPVTNLEGCNAVFVAQLTLPTKNAVSFDYSTTDGTAISPGDFTQMSGTVTIPPGRKEIGISIPLIADGSPDSGETFTMTITNVHR